MITAHETLSYLKAQPFRPFRLHMASGRTFDVRHPELVRVTKDHLLLFSMGNEDPDLVDRWEMIGHILIESISFLEALVS
jgi:hypothetical protein